jgi:hypothetical protein
LEAIGRCPFEVKVELLAIERCNGHESYAPIAPSREAVRQYP